MARWFRLPDAATAPFCPSAIQGSVNVDPKWPAWKKLATFAGPGLLISVGYMDPGNWATDIEAGSKYGYRLLFVVLLSSLAAIWLQCLSARVGLVTERDLARLARERYSRASTVTLWILAEIAIVATDVAEVLGSALALKLLFGFSLLAGVALTAFDTVVVLGLKGKGFRQVEAIVLGLVATIGVCFAAEIWMASPNWRDVALGLKPNLLSGVEPWYLAVGILGATVMPHNLYLHSSIVRTRPAGPSVADKRDALKWATFDAAGSLFLAFIVNAAILILAGAVFHAHGRGDVIGIDDAHALLAPMMGASAASWIFAIALLASGQSSTFTGTIAGQVMMEGFIDLRLPCWKRRLITRGLALAPAFLGVLWLGDRSTGRLLVISQVVLSLQLPFAIYPLVRFVSDRDLMGPFRAKTAAQTISWATFAAISAANLWLLWQLAFGR